MVGYTFAVNNLVVVTGYNIANFKEASYSGGFDRNKYWDNFASEHVCKGEEELLTLLLDLSRCHWSPKPENWPGMEVTVSYGTAGANYVVTLEPGKTRVKAFKRGKGTLYTWTASCLATAGIFKEVYVDSIGSDTTTINGNYKGYTQYCTTLMGFNKPVYAAARTAFSTWATGVGITAQPVNIATKQKKAGEDTIDKRDVSNSAFGLKNAARYLTGSAQVDGDQPTTNVVV